MSTSTAPYFFLSYSREDTAKQKRIVRELRERGINLWVDIENLTPGTPTWEREIEKAIRGAMGIVVLLSPESNNSEWVRREISFGEQHRKRIFPVLIEGDDHASTPLRLANHQRVDLRTKFESGLDELTLALNEYIGVKQDIATQSQPRLQRSTPATRIDLKKFALPALIALLGIFCIAGAIFAIRFIGDRIVTETATTPPDIDVTVTATEPVIPQNEPIGKIVYTCQVEGLNDYEICIINADGSGWRQLTDSGYTSYYASLSPDGNTIVYVNNESGDFEIYEMNTSGGGKTRLTALESDLAAPEISPDNQTIAFTNHVNNNAQIWIMNRDGNDARQLYRAQGTDALDPTWSPDGTQLLFAVGNGEDKQLYILELGGGEPRLVSDEVRTRGRSDWSNQDLITYYSNGPWEREVFTIYPDGSDLQQITDGGNAQGPSFSPDGGWIAYTAYTDVASKDEKTCEIFIRHLYSSEYRQLTDNNYCDFQPRWGN